jgi:hypothetical protein
LTTQKIKLITNIKSLSLSPRNLPGAALQASCEHTDTDLVSESYKALWKSRTPLSAKVRESYETGGYDLFCSQPSKKKQSLLN